MNEHEWPLVLIAVGVCALASWTVVGNWVRAVEASGPGGRLLWVAVGGLTAGCGVWATHFIAMLGYQYEIERGVSLGRLALSLGLGCLLFGLSVVPIMRGFGCQACRFIGAAALTLSIVVLHYVGMSAYAASALMQWDPQLIAVSVALGAAFNLGCVQFFTTGRSLTRLVVSPALFVLAVVSIHFIGMAALTMVPLDVSEAAWSGDSTFLAGATATAAVVVLAISLVASIVDQNTSRLRAAEAEKLQALTRMLGERNAELEIARERAEMASRAKSAFIANVSHEIRTPMSGVLGMSEILLESDLADRERSCAETIHRSGRALLGVIDDVLDLSKIEAGRLEIAEAPFDPRTAVEEVATLLAPAAHEKGIEILVRCAAALPSALLGDAGRVRQIVTNLAGNAVKFTAEGYVLIDVARAPPEDGRPSWRITVEDTGIGIAPHRVRAIFEEFTQAESTTARQYGGTGLGLTISSRLASLMGGRIDVVSERGRGSSFSVTLPMVPAMAEAGPPAVRPSLPTARLLLVDDLALSLDILETQCRVWGLETVRALGGEQAIALLDGAVAAGDAFDLVLLDHHMPDVDGLRVAEHIASNDRLRPAKIVVLSPTDDESVATAFRRLGAGAFLAKPIRSEALHAVLSAVLQASPRGGGVRDEASGVVAAVAPAASARERHRVLAVDDNQVNRMVVDHMLDRERYALSLAANGTEAVEAFRSARFDVVLMDISMPEMDGYQATAAIRRIEAEQGRTRTPIVCLTAHAGTEQHERCVAHDMDHYLVKPIRKSELDDVLRHATATAAPHAHAHDHAAPPDRRVSGEAGVG
ncbi:MAG: response regulator [Paracoccaceae bacterium]